MRSAVILSFLVICSTSLAGIVVRPSFGISAGEYQEQTFSEIKIGGAIHFIQAPFAIQLHGFRRFARQADDFYGLELDLKIKRQFKVSNDYLFGTYFGPGYRYVSRDLDAPTLDFSFVLSKAKIYSIFLGYKVIMLDWMSNDFQNDSLVYLGVQL